MLLSAAAVVACGVWVLTARTLVERQESPYAGDDWFRFEFVKEQHPLTDETTEFGWGMDGVVVSGHGAGSDDGPPSESRQIEYTFKADYLTLVEQADREIIRKGGKQTEGIGDHRWELPRNVSVYVSECRFDPVTHCDIADPGWVRVTLHHWYRVPLTPRYKRKLRQAF
jgi:hypothetical protein